jgi:hypothetical protein
MKENSTISAKKGPFPGDQENSPNINRDRLTGSLATATANFFHQSIQIADKAYLQIGTHV